MKAFKGVVITTYQEEITVMANTKERIQKWKWILSTTRIG